MVNGLCVLIHGFTGSPEEVEPLAEVLGKAGYEVAIPVLYGHCGCKDDLRTATASAWIHSVEPLVAEGLKDGPVHLIGFSMGAMIGTILAGKYPVQSLTLLSPAVFYVGPKQMFRQIADVIKESWDNTGGFDSTYMRRRIDKMAQTPLNSVKQFRRLVQLGKQALPDVRVPLCVIQGERDEIVEPRGASYACTKAGSVHKELHMLPQSGHMICHGPEAETVNTLVMSFLSNLDHPELTHTPKEA